MQERPLKNGTVLLAMPSVSNALLLAAVLRARPELFVEYSDSPESIPPLCRRPDVSVVLFRWSKVLELQTCSCGTNSAKRVLARACFEEPEFLRQQVAEIVSKVPGVIGVFDDSPILPWQRLLEPGKLQFWDFPSAEEFYGSLVRRFFAGRISDSTSLNLIRNAGAFESGASAPAAEELQLVLRELPFWRESARHTRYLAHLTLLLASERDLRMDVAVNAWRMDHQSVRSEDTYLQQLLRLAIYSGEVLGDGIYQVDCRSIGTNAEESPVVRDVNFALFIRRALAAMREQPKYVVILCSNYALITSCLPNERTFADFIRDACVAGAVEPVRWTAYDFVCIANRSFGAAIEALRCR